jgi:hypothetical protein
MSSLQLGARLRMKLRFGARASRVVLAVLATGCSNTASHSMFDGMGGSGASGKSGTASASGSGSASGTAASAGYNLGGTGAGTALTPSGSGDDASVGSTASTCPGGQDTTISGVVYDPAAKNPLWNITVFIPASPLPTLLKGASCAACSALYPEVLASAITDEQGRFRLTRSSTGSAIPSGTVTLVVQTGKWRMQYSIANVTACADNPQPDKSLRLPRNGTEGDLPDIAISTGAADSLECLPLRVGVDAAEYVSGSAATGHIHIFKGNGATVAGGSPASYTALWSSTAQLSANDVVLLSCESGETGNVTTANRQSMWDYASTGGRVFASHYQYSWFSDTIVGPQNVFGGPGVGTGPATPMANTGPFATANLAKWTPGQNIIDDNVALNGDIVTTLNVGGGAFPEGVALSQWLGNVGALTNGMVPIWYSRHNADVSSVNTPSQPWMLLDPNAPTPVADQNSTQYFSVDMPIGADAGGTCGRVVYSDLHVSGGPGERYGTMSTAPDYPGATIQGTAMGTGVMPVVPTGCAMRDLTPQEDALEFMLFDLSSCLVPIGAPPAPPIVPR